MSESIGNYEDNKNLIPLYTEGDPNAYLYDEVNPVARKIRYFDTNLAIINDKFVFDVEDVTSTQDVSMVAGKYCAIPISSKILDASEGSYKYIAESRIRLGTVPQGLGVVLTNRKYVEKFYNFNTLPNRLVFNYIHRDFLKPYEPSYFPRTGFVANDTILLRMVIENPYGFDALIMSTNISGDTSGDFVDWRAVTLNSSDEAASYYMAKIDTLLDDGFVTIPKKSEFVIDVGISNLTNVSGLNSDMLLAIAHWSDLYGFFVSD